MASTGVGGVPFERDSKKASEQPDLSVCSSHPLQLSFIPAGLFRIHCVGCPVLGQGKI